MFENRNLRVDLFAIALFAATVFFALALFSYNPADPTPELVSPFNLIYAPDQVAYPQLAEPSNICGRWGALAADVLFNGLGLGAYYVVGSLGLLDYFLLRRRDIDSHITRSLGWIISLAGIVALLGLAAPSWSPGPVIGSGGFAGALFSGLIRLHFATAGGIILCLSLIVGGLMLCTDYALLHAAASVVGVLAIGVQTGREKVRRKLATADDASEGDEEEYEDEAELSQPNIRIRGRNMDADGEWEDDADEADPEDEADLAAEVAEDEARDEEGTFDLEDDGENDEYDEYEEETTGEEVEILLPVKQSGDRRRAESAHTPARKPTKPGEIDRERVIEELDEASLEDVGEYDLPGLDLLTIGDDYDYDAQAKEVRRKARVLEKTFLNFGFNVKVVEIETGPVIAQFEVELEAGLRLSKITGLADDLAIALRVPSVRIVAPIPGKNTVGIEVPNASRQVVRLREVIEEANGKSSKMRIPIYLGKDVSGNPLVVDLTTMPHLLIAGRTGTGKSVCLNAIISSMLMTRRPDEVRMLMIDPKMVELSGYGRLPHLMHPVVTDMKKAEAILAWAVEKMEERYQLLAKAGVRHISSYNQLSEEEIYDRLQPADEAEKCAIPSQLPFIVIVADEIADMMMTAGKEVEQHIIRLAQKSRAVGIHLILATQKPTVDVITGLIKSNLPARISFQVASRTDSRVVLDEMGAEKLLGNGDMLFLWPGTSTLLRGQGTYLSDEEIDSVVNTVSTGEQNFVNELVNLKVEEEGEESGDVGDFRSRDELYEKAIDVVVRERRGSLSLLQRALGIGYGRAARLVDFMAEDGIVGPYAGSQAREVVMTAEDWERIKAGEAPAAAPAASSDEPPPPTISAKKSRRTKALEAKTPDPSKSPKPKRNRNNVVRPAPAPLPPWDEDEGEGAATATLNVVDSEESAARNAYEAGPDAGKQLEQAEYEDYEDETYDEDDYGDHEYDEEEEEEVGEEDVGEEAVAEDVVEDEADETSEYEEDEYDEEEGATEDNLDADGEEFEYDTESYEYEEGEDEEYDYDEGEDDEGEDDEDASAEMGYDDEEVDEAADGEEEAESAVSDESLWEEEEEDGDYEYYEYEEAEESGDEGEADEDGESYQAESA